VVGAFRTSLWNWARAFLVLLGSVAAGAGVPNDFLLGRGTWSAVFVKDQHVVFSAVAALAYSAFSVMMAWAGS